MSKIIIFLMIFFSHKIIAQSNHLIFLGGGGEPKQDHTIFDFTVVNIGNFLTKNIDWKGSISFNGGHRNTEKILQKNMGAANGLSRPFTKVEFEKIISNYEQQIMSGKLKQGDKLLLIISTHGISRNNEKSHSVLTTDVSGKNEVSLDRLQKIISLAEKSGIKLGIIDTSCHSGATLALSTKKTCVMSGSGENFLSYNIWADDLVKSMKKGKNLEQIFLETVQHKIATPVFPNISTTAGLEIKKDLESFIQVNHNIWDENLLRGEIINKSKKFLDPMECEKSKQVDEELFKKVEDFNIILKKANAHKIKEELKSSIIAYNEFQSQLRNEISRHKSVDLERKEIICTVSKEKNNICDYWKLKEILAIDFDAEIKRKEDLLLITQDPALKDWIETKIQNCKKGKIKKEEISARNEDMKGALAFFENIPQYEDKLSKLAADLARKLQETYLVLYEMRSKEMSAPNPCRDFVL